MSAGPRMLERAVGDSGTSVTFTGITASGQYLSTSYSWETPELAEAYLPDAEAVFRRRLTQSELHPTGARHAGRCGRLTGWVMTGLRFRWRPRATLKDMRHQRRRALLIVWAGAAVAIHWGDR